MEDQQQNTIEDEACIEEPARNENDIKELSMDDILGAQSLLMSESDEDTNKDFNRSPQKKVFSIKTKRILDSDDDNFDENKQILPHGKKDRNTSNKRISALTDSDSDVDTKDNILKAKRKSKDDFKVLQQNSSGSDSEIKSLERSKKLRNYKYSRGDIKKQSKKRINLIDSESSDAEFDKENELTDLEDSSRQANFEKTENKKSKVIRASAKKAIEEMQAIQSEQQRLHREAHISIPYHKPKKHTLDEFLTRRTVIQPQKDDPVVAAIQERSLKMTTEELEEYAKLMEERAKEATEFFKAESENEEVIPKENDEIPLDFQNEIENEVPSVGHNDITNELTENQDNVQLTKDELTALLTKEERISQVQQERPSCSKILITEVIELPKLDMNTIRISPIKKNTPRAYLNVKKLLAEKSLPESPSLRGDPNKLIDLETGDLIEKMPTGVESLMKRLISSVKSRKPKYVETCNILSVENGKLEISKVNISRSKTKDLQKEAKPGAAYFELKNNLKQIITKKRLEEMNRKQEDELQYIKCLEGDDDNEVDENEETSVEEEYEPDSKPQNDIMVDDEENALVAEDDGEISGDETDHNSFADYNDDNDDNDEDLEDIFDNNNTESLDTSKSQRKSRIIKAFDDTDEEDGQNDDIDFLKTQQPMTPPPLLETQSSVKIPLEDEETELIALCSGTFDETQKTALMSQIPITEINNDKPVYDKELMELCSGAFDQSSLTAQASQCEEISEQLKAKCNKILSSDEENDDENLNKNQEDTKKVKKLTKKRWKKKAKLGFSDDEDEDSDEGEYEDNKQVAAEYDGNFETATDEPETFVDYDSEENEIIVQMTKDDKMNQAQNFFEKEAELSESEWGSADEDENNLDKYDIELGDEDEFDREKLQTELGQIHARKMLDEDIRNVRKIQEMLLEDEEKDGVGRQRTFKWKNAESGFSLDDGRQLDENGDGQNGDSGDEINEHQWRKIRYEREQFLKEQGIQPESQNISAAVSLNSPATITLNSKKLQIVTAKKSALFTSDSRKRSPFLISKDPTAMQKNVRGSFLVRDKDTLNKLAGITKCTSSSITVSEIDDTTGTVSLKSVKPKNFVFATLTEEEHENIKRKADDLLNSSNEYGKNFMKKPKIEPRRDKCFIDQLL